MTGHGKTSAGPTAAVDNRTEPQHLEAREPGEKFTTRIENGEDRTETTIKGGSNKYGGGPDKPRTGDARSNSERNPRNSQYRTHSPREKFTSNKSNNTKLPTIKQATTMTVRTNSTMREKVNGKKRRIYG